MSSLHTTLSGALSDFGQQLATERERLLSSLVESLAGVQVRGPPPPPVAAAATASIACCACHPPSHTFPDHNPACRPVDHATPRCWSPAWRRCSTSGLQTPTRATLTSSMTGRLLLLLLLVLGAVAAKFLSS